MLVIDTHHHYVPPALVARYDGGRSGTQVAPPGMTKINSHPGLSDVDERLRTMDAAGVDVAVLSSILSWDASAEECRITNDAFAGLQTSHPGRFAGLAHVPTGMTAESLNEVDRALGDLGLRGLSLPSQPDGHPLDAPELWPLYEKACAWDVPIFVHPAMPPRGYAFIGDYDLSRIVGRELDLILQTTRIIASGLLDRFPTLTFVMSHMGGGIAAITERLRGKQHRFGPHLERSFDEYLGRIHFDLAGFEGGPGALACALTALDPATLLFGTDFPQDFSGVGSVETKGAAGIAAYVRAVADLDLPDGLPAAILGGTAARLLGLDSSGRPRA
ncbi:amidohydrolase family protein [Actinomadura rayongensis]|uniref:Amidohydrolase family protein n=1 Tax=Actinomadura rayongensis TaxID=1429076 RepID=A0A6I4WB46_9ACTN|nr:amidohydrolase family protein [Actinomadura rayongensis]